MSGIRFLGSCLTGPAGPNELKLFCKHLEDSVQNDFIFHLPANLMTRSLCGPCSKPLSWKQLHCTVARGGPVLVMVAAKELKEALTEDRDLPNFVGMDAAERNQQAREAAAEGAAEQKPQMKQEITEVMGDDLWTGTCQ